MYARCRKSDLTKRHAANLYVDDRNEVLYCYIPKVACSTFKALLASSASQTPVAKIIEAHPGHDLGTFHKKSILSTYDVRPLTAYNVTGRKLRLETYFKFVAVRHPFDRLLSAWRDKKEFLKYHTQVNNATDKQLERFREFLTQVANGARNVHWDPMVRSCNPCGIKFNSIVRLETANQDLPLILSKLTDPEGKPNSLPTANKMSPYAPEEKLKRLSEFYRGVNQTVIQRLLSLYADDFRLFGYTWNVGSATGNCDNGSSEELNKGQYCSC